MPLFGTEPHLYLYGGKLLHSADWANKKIAKLINGDDPFLIARFGNTELHVLNAYMAGEIAGKCAKYDALMEEWWDNLYTLCGFFPKDEKYQKAFSELILLSAMQTDILGVWNRPMEDYYLKTRMPDASITALRWLEPWYSKTPWTWALEGKKILVVHPFEKSIRLQYENRKALFPENELLPDFHLDVIKAVQTLGDAQDDRFETWFEALDWMTEECRSDEFDVAIIGCGAYGYPLAARIKKMGKCAIHLAGATQLLFGITGKRWETEYIYREFRNDIINQYWIRPSEHESVKNQDNVEHGCYW